MSDSKEEFSKQKYRRNLPHIQRPGIPIFVTFCTFKRWILPEQVRAHVLQHCLHDHMTRAQFHCVIVMPDHVHILLTLLRDAKGNPHSLDRVMNGIKGASAHTVNRLLARHGTVWQDESYDHILREHEAIGDVIAYIQQNPVRRGLVSSANDWSWFWHHTMPLPNSIERQ